MIKMIYIWYLHDIFHGFCNLHIQILKFGKKSDKFEWKSEEKNLGFAEPVEPAFYKSVLS